MPRRVDPPIPTIEDVRAVLDDLPRTVREIAQLACGQRAWDERTHVRKRLYELEAMGLARIKEGFRPMRFTKGE